MTAPRRLVGPNLYLYVKSTPSSEGKVFFQLSKKVVPKAVDRNLIKRRFGGILREVKYKPVNQEIKIGAKTKITPLPFSELKAELASLLSKI